MSTKIVHREFGSDDPDLPPDILDLPPNQQNIRVQATKSGRKGKTVTVITGFQTTTEKLGALLKQLKTQCGSGGTLKDQTIEIQGDHTTKLLQILTQIGYKVKKSGG